MHGFKDIGKLMKAQSEIKKMQKRLRKIEVEGESKDGLVKAVVNGDNKIVRINLDEEKYKDVGIKQLERAITEAVNSALDSAKEIISKEMMNMPDFDIAELANKLKGFK